MKFEKGFSYFKPHRHNIRSTNHAHLWQHTRPRATSLNILVIVAAKRMIFQKTYKKIEISSTKHLKSQI